MWIYLLRLKCQLNSKQHQYKKKKMRFKTTVAISLSAMRTIFHAQRMIHRANGYSIFSYLHHRTLSGDQSYLDLVTKPNHPNLMVIDPYLLTRTVTSLSYLCFSLILCSYSLSSGLRHVACKGEINLFCSELCWKIFPLWILAFD